MSITRLNKEIRRLKSELKTSDKGFQKSQKRIEELTEGDSLEKVLESQRDPVEELRDRMRKQFKGDKDGSR